MTAMNPPVGSDDGFDKYFSTEACRWISDKILYVGTKIADHVAQFQGRRSFSQS
jgi:hypothetical protein